MSFANTLTLQRITTLINLALIALGAYFSVTLFYHFVGLQVQSSPMPPLAAEGGAGGEFATARPLSYYNPILERDLFQIKKTPQSPAAKASLDLENLKKTQLSLKLWGTVSGDPDQAYAVIEDMQKREQNLYRTGDSVQNATLKVILRERVVLSVDGKDEVLSMEDMQQGATVMVASRGRAPSAPSAVPPPPAAEQRISLQRGMIEESFQDMNKLMTQIAIAPNMENGQPAGLSLNRIAPDSIFRRMGLRNGDVLLGINGQPIQSADDAMRIYEGLKSSEEFQLQLKRRGQERSINYSIR